MALPRIGGETPIVKYGLDLSIEAPTGTDATTPVLPGQIFKLGGTDSGGGGYKAAVLTAGDDGTNAVLVYALHKVTDLSVPLGVKVICAHGLSQVRRLPYKTGSAPSIGQSVEAATVATKQIVGKAWAVGDGYVLFVDTDAEDAEVLC
jgi:hypothetical protein